MENVRTFQGKYFGIDHRKLSSVNRIDASPLTTLESSTSSQIQSYEGIVFLAYMRYEPQKQNLTYWLAVSFDEGSDWDFHIHVRTYGNVNDGRVSLTVHQDKIFYLMCVNSNIPLNRIQHVIVTPFLNWRNISQGETRTLCSNENIVQTSIKPFSDGLVIFTRSEDQVNPFLRIYSNGTWSQRINMGISSGWICPVVFQRSGDDVLTLFSVSLSTPSRIFYVNSTDGGYTWSSPRIVAISNRDIFHMTVLMFHGKANLAVTYKSGYKVGFCTLDISKVNQIDDIIQLDQNGLDNTETEIAISGDEHTIDLICEDRDGTISVYRSIDDGNTFDLKRTIGAGSIHSPSTDIKGQYLIMINGTQLEVLKWGPANDGVVISNIISVPAISSWDEFGISLGGAAHDNAFKFRFISPDGGEQLFPEIGFQNLSGLEPGRSSDHYYRYKGNFSGGLSTGEELRSSVVVELSFSRVGGMSQPVLSGFFLNYTVSYPFREDFSDDRNIIDSQGCKVTSIGLELDQGRNDGSAILGPFQKESFFPDHLSCSSTFVDSQNWITLGILGTDGEVIEGFREDDSERITEPDEVHYIEWSGMDIGDLSTILDQIYLLVTIHASSSISPKLRWLELGSSEVPDILSLSISDRDVLRSGYVDMEFTLFDREDPPERLDLTVEIKDPVTGEWTDDHMEEPVFTYGVWGVRFHTDFETNVGFYEIRAMVSDGSGLSTPFIEMDTGFKVENNIPVPPLVSLLPHSLTGDSIIRTKGVWEGSDLETELQSLRYNFYLFREGSLMTETDNETSLEQTFQIDLNKHEMWELRVRTWDGINESEPLILDFTVSNSPPVPTNIPSDIELTEDQDPLFLSTDKWFEDLDEDDLSLNYVVSPGIFLKEVPQGIEIEPLPDHHGMGYLLVRVSDGEAQVHANITISVTQVNDPPIWKELDDTEVYEGEWLHMTIEAYDPSDNEFVTVTSNLVDVLGAVPGTDLIEFPNGSFSLLATNDMVGRKEISFFIDDGTFQLEENFNLTVLNTNQPPSEPVVNISKERSFFLQGESFTLTGESMDPDLIWGDELTYSWRSDLDGDLGQGVSIEPDLGPGSHTITVEVSDSSGETNSTSFEVEISPESENGKKPMRTALLLTITGLSAFLATVIISVVILLLFLKLNKKDKKEKDKETDEKKATGKKMKEVDDSHISDNSGPGKPEMGIGSQTVPGSESVDKIDSTNTMKRTALSSAGDVRTQGMVSGDKDQKNNEKINENQDEREVMK